MNESDLLMTSLPPVLPPIGWFHNSSPLNYIDEGVCVYNLASGVYNEYCASTTSRGQSSQIVRVALTYEKYLFLKYLVKFLRVYLMN